MNAACGPILDTGRRRRPSKGPTRRRASMAVFRGLRVRCVVCGVETRKGACDFGSELKSRVFRHQRRSQRATTDTHTHTLLHTTQAQVGRWRRL